MGNDIQISVRVSNDTGAGLAAVNTSLQGLKNNAQQAGQALHSLTGRSTAASQSLRLLDSRAESATNALRGLRAAAGDIRVTASIDNQTASSITSIKAALRDLKRESPIRLTAQFDGDSGQIAAAATAMRDLRGDANGAGTALTGLTTRSAAAAAALNSLEQQADGASRALRTLRGRAAAAADAMGEFRDRVTAVTAALRTFNTRAQTADGRLNTLSASTRTLRGNMDDLDGSVGRLAGNLGGLRGNLGSLRNSSASAGGGMEGLRVAAIALAPALIPIAAAAVPIAAGLGAAGVAVAAFGVAIGGQIKSLSEASEAQEKYEKAVRDYGRGSQQAAKAETEYLRLVKEMPAPTRQAAAALGILKDEYKSWSESLAGDTMPVATKAFANFGALLPKLSPLVRGTSAELDRLMTVMAGGIESDGFSRFMASFSEFASGALARATTGLVKFSQSLDSGKVGGNFAEFMDYTREVGPAVGETLGNLAKAMVHLVASASDLGVSVLTAVNALAELVNAVPTGALSTFIQMYAALKLVSIGVGLVGAAASSGAIARLGAYFAVMRAAGVSTTMRATAASMTAMQKAAVGLGVLTVAAIGISKIAENARGAPPNVDKLTTSLKNLAQTGKFTGELKSTFGDIDGLVAKVKEFGKATQEQEEYVESFGNAGIGPLDDLRRKFHGLFDDFRDGSQSFNALEADFDSLDQSMAAMVASGYAGQAGKDFSVFEKALKGAGKSTKEINDLFPEYRAAMANLKAEQRLAADGMGLFGEQALAVQGKLNAQKSSADGLRQSIVALNEAHRAGLAGQSGFEAAIDAMAKAAAANAGSLRMVNGELDLNSESARNAEAAMRDVAAKTDEYAASTRESGASWEKVSGIYERGRKELLKQAGVFFKNKEQAAAYVDSILKIPDEATTRLKMKKEDAQRDLNAFASAVKRHPSSKSVTLKTLSKSAEQILREFGFKVQRLKDGSVKISANTGQALGGIAAVARARNALRDKTVTFTTHYRIVGSQARTRTGHGSQLANADGSVTDYYAQGGIRSFANGSERHVAQVAPAGSMRVWAEPETGGEAYIPLSEAKRSRSLAILEEVADRFGYGLEEFARGGLTKRQKAQKAAKARAAAKAKAERDARGDARGDLTISHFGKMAGYQRSEFGTALSKPDSIGSLVSALNQWRGVIMKATHGRTEKNLLRQLDSTGRALLKQERALSKVTAELDKAKSKLSDLKSAASQLASSVKSNILGSANITRGASGEGRVTTASIMGGLVGSRDKATAFAQALKDLKKKGLSKDLLAQVAEAGIDGGGLETASALLGASGSEIKSMNDLQAQIAKAATAAGKTTADAVYGAQIKAQQKLVTALKSHQTSLTKSMDRLTKAMEKAIEKAFSKKASGGIVGAAASGGVRGGLTLTGEEGPEIVRLPVGSRVYPAGQSKRMAWESMLTEPQRPAARPTRGAGAVGRPEPVVIEIRSSGNETDEFLLKMLRKAIRVRGGNAQVVLGRAGA